MLVLRGLGHQNRGARQAEQFWERPRSGHQQRGAALSSWNACQAGLLWRLLYAERNSSLCAGLAASFWLAGLQVDLTLVAEQTKSDFRPGDADPPPSFDLPTGACSAVTALLGAAAQLAAQHLHGPNLAALQAEVRAGDCRASSARLHKHSRPPFKLLSIASTPWNS